MAQMSTVPVFQCRCGKFVKVTLLETAMPDAGGVLLEQMMHNLSKIIMCDDCRRSYHWYAMQGRTADWRAGRP